jgi:hypothetical protein
LREREYAYLESDTFSDVLARSGYELADASGRARNRAID